MDDEINYQVFQSNFLINLLKSNSNQRLHGLSPKNALENIMVEKNQGIWLIYYF